MLPSVFLALLVLANSWQRHPGLSLAKRSRESPGKLRLPGPAENRATQDISWQTFPATFLATHCCQAFSCQLLTGVSLAHARCSAFPGMCPAKAFPSVCQVPRPFPGDLFQEISWERLSTYFDPGKSLAICSEGFAWQRICQAHSWPFTLRQVNPWQSVCRVPRPFPGALSQDMSW